MSRLFFSIVAMAALAGCEKPEEQSPEAKERVVSLYKEGIGVFLPEEMKERTGIELAEVKEIQLRVEFQKVGQVFRAAGNGTLAQASVLVEAQQARTISTGAEVKLKSPAGEAAGKVSAVDAQTEAALGLWEVVVSFDDPAREFPAGSFLTAVFAPSSAETAAVVPASAVLRAAEGEFVYVVNGTHFTRTKVRTGACADGVMEVKDGLYPGDSVVVKGMKELWLIELQATKTGKPCCVVTRK